MSDDKFQPYIPKATNPDGTPFSEVDLKTKKVEGLNDLIRNGSMTQAEYELYVAKVSGYDLDSVSNR